MRLSTWITMAVIVAFVWGGFVLALATAVRKEAGKVPEDRSDASA